MSSQGRPLLRFLKARLSKRISIWILASIFLIELIILVPSVYRRKQELLQQLAMVSSGKEDNKILNLRIGINTGPVVAGVIGLKKFSYDLWGDAVNIASPMESHGKVGEIHVTEATYELLKHQYVLEKRGIVQVKGRGEMTTYWLKSRKPASVESQVLT